MIHLVCGPPCSGKSTLVAEQARATDLVVDHDHIAQQLGSPRSHNHHGQYAQPAERQVQQLLAEIAAGQHPDAWIIRSVPTAEQRTALADQVGAQRIVLLLDDRDVLVSRAQTRPNPAATIRVIDWWLSRYTEDHDMRRSTTQRGYGGRHQAKRREWAPHVEAGRVDCHAVICLEQVDGRGRRIEPGTPWNLGHTPDRSRWTGPEHERCNKTEPQFRAGYRPVPPTSDAVAPPQRQVL